MAVQGKQVVDYLMQYLGRPYKWAAPRLKPTSTVPV